MSQKILHERNNEKEQWTKKNKNHENRGDSKGDGSSFDTQGSKNQVKRVGKKNIDHLEGEFKNINKTNFNGEWKTGEEA